MSLPDFRYFNPFADTVQKRNRLPHWEQAGVLYFLTFRLADALPSDLLEGWRAERDQWVRLHPEPWSADLEREYHDRFSSRAEKWLDAGHGDCVLRVETLRMMVAKALLHFEGTRCRMISFVFMPNHVHALFVIHPNYGLADLVGSWKRHSARCINSKLCKSGSLWQKDYFDRMVRDASHFENCVRYIRRNPSKAGLSVTEYTLFESAVALDVR